MKITELLTEGKKGVKNPVKPRNFVAKNAMATTSGAGAHKDKKKAAKQGDVKHKGKEQELAESSSSYYYEKLADELFALNPNLDTSGRADEVLNAAFPLIVRDLGSKKRANNLLNYDEDFPSDFVSAYADLQRSASNSQDVAEGKQKGVDGKACWDGYKRMGTKKKGGKTVDNCVPTGKK